MRLLILHPYATRGGAESRIRSLVGALARRPDMERIHLIHAGEPGRREGVGKVQRWFTDEAHCADIVEDLATHHGVDVVQMHNEQEIGVGGLRRAHALGLPTLWVMHDFWPLCGMRFLTNVFLAEQVPRCSVVDRSRCDDCVGPEQADRTRRMAEVVARCDLGVVPTRRAAELLSANGLLSDRLQVIHPWIDLERFAPDAAVQAEEGRVLFAGPSLPHKGIGVLLRAWHHVENVQRHATLDIVGDGRYIERVEQYAGEFGLQRVSVRGAVSQNELRTLYSRAALTVFPSIWEETIGLTWIESLACSTPVVASRIGGIPELLRAGGRLFEPGAAAHLAGIVCNLLADRERRLELGEEGRNFVTNNFDPSRAAQTFQALYRRLSLTGRSTAT